jgi:hypothetical protein
VHCNRTVITEWLNIASKQISYIEDIDRPMESRQICIVEDDSAIREMLRFFLVKDGWQVCEAADNEIDDRDADYNSWYRCGEKRVPGALNRSKAEQWFNGDTIQ